MRTPKPDPYDPKAYQPIRPSARQRADKQADRRVLIYRDLLRYQSGKYGARTMEGLRKAGITDPNMSIQEASKVLDKDRIKRELLKPDAHASRRKRRYDKTNQQGFKSHYANPSPPDITGRKG